MYQPEGRDRLSDWARQPDTFRYLDTGDLKLLVNAATAFPAVGAGIASPTLSEKGKL